MKNKTQTLQLLKILIGAAWIDGEIQAEEREYLHKMAAENNLVHDPEIKPLLSELKQVKPDECYTWLEDYLGEHPSKDDYEELLEALSALIYSDGNVDTEEAKLLNKLQDVALENEAHSSAFDKLLKRIQRLYRQAIK
ncbi:MAG: TerB family tellurite resistance protein [Gomphosphaeria aponina SAG 52.96 = DSM 107014]|uniref:TerB family tellurite resistance protein n=1 Tax=Gomphosphaeria aponina SAG 52.96 = DSM 107014 TaxID=1521640 RepID=A0A941GQ01_9CHRO|nr:TerB family tellurite resistance protein [Gomphosphaeria aponina SAG 52.96 = DSM 107014]